MAALVHRLNDILRQHRISFFLAIWNSVESFVDPSESDISLRLLGMQCLCAIIEGQYDNLQMLTFDFFEIISTPEENDEMWNMQLRALELLTKQGRVIKPLGGEISRLLYVWIEAQKENSKHLSRILAYLRNLLKFNFAVMDVIMIEKSLTVLHQLGESETLEEEDAVTTGILDLIDTLLRHGNVPPRSLSTILVLLCRLVGRATFQAACWNLVSLLLSSSLGFMVMNSLCKMISDSSFVSEVASLGALSITTEVGWGDRAVESLEFPWFVILRAYLSMCENGSVVQRSTILHSLWLLVQRRGQQLHVEWEWILNIVRQWYKLSMGENEVNAADVASFSGLIDEMEQLFSRKSYFGDISELHAFLQELLPLRGEKTLLTCLEYEAQCCVPPAENWSDRLVEVVDSRLIPNAPEAVISRVLDIFKEIVTYSEHMQVGEVLVGTVVPQLLRLYAHKDVSLAIKSISILIDLTRKTDGKHISTVVKAFLQIASEKLLGNEVRLAATAGLVHCFYALGNRLPSVNALDSLLNLVALTDSDSDEIRGCAYSCLVQLRADELGYVLLGRERCSYFRIRVPETQARSIVSVVPVGDLFRKLTGKFFTETNYQNFTILSQGLLGLLSCLYLFEGLDEEIRTFFTTIAQRLVEKSFGQQVTAAKESSTVFGENLACGYKLLACFGGFKHVFREKDREAIMSAFIKGMALQTLPTDFIERICKSCIQSFHVAVVEFPELALKYSLYVAVVFNRLVEEEGAAFFAMPALQFLNSVAWRRDRNNAKNSSYRVSSPDAKILCSLAMRLAMKAYLATPESVQLPFFALETTILLLRRRKKEKQQQIVQFLSELSRDIRPARSTLDFTWLKTYGQALKMLVQGAFYSEFPKIRDETRLFKGGVLHAVFRGCTIISVRSTVHGWHQLCCRAPSCYFSWQISSSAVTKGSVKELIALGQQLADMSAPQPQVGVWRNALPPTHNASAQLSPLPLERAASDSHLDLPEEVASTVVGSYNPSRSHSPFVETRQRSGTEIGRTDALRPILASSPGPICWERRSGTSNPTASPLLPVTTSGVNALVEAATDAEVQQFTAPPQKQPADQRLSKLCSLLEELSMGEDPQSRSELGFSDDLLNSVLGVDSGGEGVIILRAEEEGFERALDVLDDVPFVATHKIALLYIAPGMEDETQILSTVNCSSAFMDFARALGKLYPLLDCPFYTGGLDTSTSARDGTISLFSVDAVRHVVFHVPSFMPNLEQDPERQRKKSHIGNDYVTIVFTESESAFRMDTLKGQFNLVTIVLRKLSRTYVRIEILKKYEALPPFGPLRDGMVISYESLAELVGLTAMHANIACRIYMERKGNKSCNIMERARQMRNLRDRFGRAPLASSSGSPNAKDT
jgi:hypothetical protein